MGYSIFVGNEYLGEADAWWWSDSEPLLRGTSLRYFCRECGEFWASLALQPLQYDALRAKGLPLGPRWATVNAACVKHGSGELPGGSLLFPWQSRTPAGLPVAVLQREFDLLTKGANAPEGV